MDLESALGGGKRQLKGGPEDPAVTAAKATAASSGFDDKEVMMMSLSAGDMDVASSDALLKALHADSTSPFFTEPLFGTKKFQAQHEMSRDAEMEAVYYPKEFAKDPEMQKRMNEKSQAGSGLTARIVKGKAQSDADRVSEIKNLHVKRDDAGNFVPVDISAYFETAMSRVTFKKMLQWKNLDASKKKSFLTWQGKAQNWAQKSGINWGKYF